MEPNVNGSRVSRKSKHAHHSKPYDRDERSKRNKHKRRDEESTGFFGVLKSTVERLFTYKPTNDDNISESDNETDMSESEPEYPQLPPPQQQQQRPTELPKLLPPPPTTIPAPTADITSDIIARAIENRRDISVVEYEYYNKLLKDRLQHQAGFEPRSPAFSRTVMTPNEVMRSYKIETPEPTSLKRNARAVSPKEEQHQPQLVEVNKPPPKRRVYEEVPPVSETTKRILSTLDNMSSPLQDARAKPPPVYKTVKPITEFTPRKLEKVSMPVPSKPVPPPITEKPFPAKTIIEEEIIEEEEEEEIPLPKTKKNKSKKMTRKDEKKKQVNNDIYSKKKEVIDIDLDDEDNEEEEQARKFQEKALTKVAPAPTIKANKFSVLDDIPDIGPGEEEIPFEEVAKVIKAVEKKKKELSPEPLFKAVVHAPVVKAVDLEEEEEEEPKKKRKDVEKKKEETSNGFSFPAFKPVEVEKPKETTPVPAVVAVPALSFNLPSAAPTTTTSPFTLTSSPFSFPEEKKEEPKKEEPKKEEKKKEEEKKETIGFSFSSTPAKVEEPAKPLFETPAFTVSSSFTFPAAEEKKEEEKKKEEPIVAAPSLGFSFTGLPKAAAAEEPVKATEEPAKPALGGFVFGSTTAPAAKEETKSIFGATSTTAAPASTGFSFGVEKKEDKPATTVASLFETKPATTAPSATTAAPPTGFSFDSAKTDTGFTFGAPATAPASTSSFTFGAPETPASETKADTGNMFVFGGGSSTTAASSSSSSSGFSFGSTATTTPAPAPATSGFSFGSTATTTPAPSTSGFGFGATTTPAPAPMGDSSFVFGNPAGASTSAFGSGSGSSTGSGFSFGSTAATTGSGFSFGGTTAPAPTPAPSSGFTFGGDSSSSFTSSPFGSSTFGVTAQAPAPTAAFTFGQSAPADTGFSFGQSSTPPPTFFGGDQAAPAFDGGFSMGASSTTDKNGRKVVRAKRTMSKKS